MDDTPYGRTRKFEIQVQVGPQWKTLVAGTTIGSHKHLAFDKIKARLFRLVISEATEVPVIAEPPIVRTVNSRSDLDFCKLIAFRYLHNRKVISMPLNDHLESMIDQAMGILDSEENVIRDEFTRFNTIYVDNIKSERVTFELQPTLPAIAKTLGYDLDRFFQDRDFNFEKTLEYRLWHREHIPDDSPFIGIYEMDYGCHSLEYAMFGIMPRWSRGETPSYGLPIIETRDDLKKLCVPDFFEAGFMPRLIEDYQRIKTELNGRLEVGIRKSVQGPFQTATGLRGQENVFMEQLTEPDFVQELMEFAFTFHKAWVQGWAKLHGREYGRFNIGDDDIDTKFTVPPRVFRSLVLPMHRRYGQQFKAIQGTVAAIPTTCSRTSPRYPAWNCWRWGRRMIPWPPPGFSPVAESNSTSVPTCRRW